MTVANAYPLTVLYLARRLWRYTRLIVNIVASWTFKPILPSSSPIFTSRDITVVIPTLGDSDDFDRCILSIAACLPHSIIVVTPAKNVERIRKHCTSLGLHNVKVLGSPKANKRLQMVQGLKSVQTSFTVFADGEYIPQVLFSLREFM